MDQPFCGASDRRGGPDNWACWGPFGSNTAQAAVEDNQVSMRPDLVVDTASIEPADAQSNFIMLGAKNGGGNDNGDNAQGHGGGNSSPGRGGGEKSTEGRVEPGGSGTQGKSQSDPDGDFN
jgi:hypothetical protein